MGFCAAPVRGQMCKAIRHALMPELGAEMKKLIALAALLFASTMAFGHSGGTDKMGCHRDHSTGLYHCH